MAYDFDQAACDIQKAAAIAPQNGAGSSGHGFYGAYIAAGMGESKCPTLLFFSGNDPWIPSADIETVAAHHADAFVSPKPATVSCATAAPTSRPTPLRMRGPEPVRSSVRTSAALEGR